MRPGWGIDIADRMEFYRRAYRNGIYSLETLINIYNDYELHRDGWINSNQMQNFFRWSDCSEGGHKRDNGWGCLI